MFGERCHFRHEFRSFTKIHRHFYIAHAAALRLTAEEILLDSKIMPDGDDEFISNDWKETEEAQYGEVLSANRQRQRLSCFLAVAADESSSRGSDTDSTYNKSLSDDQPKVGESDIDAMLDNSF